MMNRTRAYYGGLQENKQDRQYHKQYSSIMPVEIVQDTENNSTKFINYIGGDAYSAPIAQIKQVGGTSINEYHYLHRDYLGSILAITNSTGAIKEETQFGAWGVVDNYKKAGVISEFSHNSLLGRGFTGHEHFFDVSLIHMNGRMYDAKVGRFLSPDNYIQDPFNTQSFNRYSYVWNNPLTFTDPSGEFLGLAILVGAIIGAAIGAGTYIVNALITGNWDWGGFAMSILGGAITGAIGGAIAPGMFPAIMTMSHAWGLVATGIVASFLPAVTIPIGDFSFSLSPAIAFGNAASIGASFNVSYKDGDFNVSAGYGLSLVSKAHGTGGRGWEHRISASVGYDDGKFRTALYSTHFTSGANGETTQRVGGISIGHGDWNVRYENDGNPFGGWAGDGGDSRRTAALNLGYKDYSIGFNIFTGDAYEGLEKGQKPSTEDVSGHPNSSTRRPGLFGLLGKKGVTGGQYDGGTANDYRLGALYFSYKGFRFGRNSEAIRHAIQNIGAHTGLSYQPWYKVLTIQPQGYFQYQSANPYTLW
jgi:RHS repeat-associated protein